MIVLQHIPWREWTNEMIRYDYCVRNKVLNSDILKYAPLIPNDILVFHWDEGNGEYYAVFFKKPQ